jgi:hypothetical protein
MERKRVGIVLFEYVEVLDFCGPFEVFSATRLNEEKRREEPSPFEVSSERTDGGTRGRSNTSLKPMVYYERDDSYPEGLSCVEGNES